MKKIWMLFPLTLLIGVLVFSPNKEQTSKINAAEGGNAAEIVKEKIAYLDEKEVKEIAEVYDLDKEMSIEETVLLDEKEIDKYYEILKAKEGRSLFSNEIKEEEVAKITYASQMKPGVGAEALDWWNSARYLYKVGTVAKVTDVETGISFNIVRTGGINHADNEPMYLEDTQIMKSIVGEWGWHIRPVIIEFNGNRLAASMYWQPHGYQTRLDNGFEGHFCIHFINSTHHYSGKINEEHQKAVRQAEGK